MKKTLLRNSITLTAFLFVQIITNCQSPALAYTVGWQKVYGGSNDEENDYKGHTIANAPDGGYFFIGNSKSNDGNVSGNHGKFDVWVARIDASGNIVWQRCIGGNQDEDGMVVTATADGGCLVGGQTYSNNGDMKGNHGGADAFATKLSRTGTVEWERTLGSNRDDGFTDALQNTDGSYILAGYTSGNNSDVSGNHGGQDAWLVKLNTSGFIQWQKCFGGSGDDADRHQTKIIRCLEGGYMLITTAASFDGDVLGFHSDTGDAIGDGWLVKLNDDGSIQWNKCYGSINWEYFENINQLKNGDYIISGASHGSGGDIPTTNGTLADWWVTKISQSGNIKWSRIYGGSGAEALHGKIYELPNGDLIMPSGTRSNDHDCIGTNGLPDVWIVKTDSLGNILSYNLFGGPGYENTSYSVMGSDGSLTVCATTDPTDLSVNSTGGHDANSQLWILHLLPNPADTLAITTTSLSQTVLCASLSALNLSVAYTKRGTFKGNNIFTAELSDANGSFVPPIIVGTTHSSSPGAIACTVPGNLPAGDHYAIRVRSSNPVYTGITSGHLLSIQPCSVTRIANSGPEQIVKPGKTSFLQVFPNPISNSATISISIPEPGIVSLSLFDVNGRFVANISNKFFEPGLHQIDWSSSMIRSGMYFLKMETANCSLTQKVSVLK